MVKQIILPIVGVIAFIALVGYIYKSGGDLNIPGVPRPSASKTVTLSGKTINVELANTKELRQKGLSGRTSLSENDGMLFTFDSQDVDSIFWMKDMKISIDIIWINDGKILKIDANVQPPKEGAPDSELIRYSPGAPYDYVLEVNAGYAEKNSISPGAEVDLSKAL